MGAEGLPDVSSAVLSLILCSGSRCFRWWFDLVRSAELFRGNRLLVYRIFKTSTILNKTSIDQSHHL